MNRALALLIALGVVGIWNLINLFLFGWAFPQLVRADKKIAGYLIMSFAATAGVIGWTIFELGVHP